MAGARAPTGILAAVTLGLAAAAAFGGVASADSPHASKARCQQPGPYTRGFWGAPKKYVQVDKGSFTGRCWTLWMKGGPHRRCHYLALAGPVRVAGAGGCERRAGSPRPRGWRQLLGAKVNGGMVILQITGRRVRYLRARAGPGRPQRRIQQRTKELSRREARRAHLRRDFRYAVAHAPGRLCIRRVVALDRNRTPVGTFRRPCAI